MTNLEISEAHRGLLRAFLAVNAAWTLVLGVLLGPLGSSHHLPGLLLGGSINLVGLVIVSRAVEAFFRGGGKAQGALSFILLLKSIAVLATLGVLVYLRPALGFGIALGYAGLLPASLAVAGLAAWQRLNEVTPEE